MTVDCKHIELPVLDTSGLRIGDRVIFSGKVYAGRDAVLPKVCELIAKGREGELGIDHAGFCIFHTAVSEAGIGPTSSNKLEIEESFGLLCEAGARVFLGKGALKPETVEKMAEYGAVFAVVPPVTALLGKGILSKRLVAFPELGMEAFYEVELNNCPAVIAAIRGESVF